MVFGTVGFFYWPRGDTVNEAIVWRSENCCGLDTYFCHTAVWSCSLLSIWWNWCSAGSSVQNSCWKYPIYYTHCVCHLCRFDGFSFIFSPNSGILSQMRLYIYLPFLRQVKKMPQYARPLVSSLWLVYWINYNYMKPATPAGCLPLPIIWLIGYCLLEWVCPSCASYLLTHNGAW